MAITATAFAIDIFVVANTIVPFLKLWLYCTRLSISFNLTVLHFNTFFSTISAHCFSRGAFVQAGELTSVVCISLENFAILTIQHAMKSNQVDCVRVYIPRYTPPLALSLSVARSLDCCLSLTFLSFSMLCF